MLDKLLHFISVYPSKEFSYTSDHIISYGQGYEISSSSRYTFFKEYYLYLCKNGLLNISVRDYITLNKELRKTLQKYKPNFLQRLFGMERSGMFDFDADEFEELYDKNPRYVELDMYIRPNNLFIYKLFYSVEEEIGTGGEEKDAVGEELYKEINKTLKDQKTYSGELEIGYIFKNFITCKNRYVYFLLKDLEDAKHVKIKNIIIKNGRITFKLSHFTEIQRSLFTSIEDQSTVTYKKTSYFQAGKFYIDGTHVSLNEGKPKYLIQLFYELKNENQSYVLYNDIIEFLNKSQVLGYEKIKGIEVTKSKINRLLDKNNIAISNKEELKGIVIGDFFVPKEDRLVVQF